MTATKQSPLEGQQEMFPSAARTLEIRYVLHAEVHPDPDQPRVEADAELKASIQAEGIRQPIQVRPHPDLLGEFMILDGERRWQGAAGVMASVPVIVREDQEESARRLVGQLVSNNAKPLTPLEEARAFGKILTETGWDQSELAQRLGIPRTTLGDRLRLLELGPWLDVLERGDIPFSYAVESLIPIRGVPDVHHAAAIKRLRADYRWGGKGPFGGSADDFKNIVTRVYQSFCYPLTKSKDSYALQPEFPTSLHDTECSCGGVTLAIGNGVTPRKCCGDPAWWKPKRDAVRRAEKAKQPSAKKAATRTPTWAKLPEGAGRRKSKGYSDVGKGETEIVIAGHWAGGRGESPFDPAKLLELVDPKKLTYLETENYGEPKVVTSDLTAVMAARETFAAGWAEKESAAFAAARAELLEAANVARIEGPGAPVLAAALADSYEDGADLALVARMLGRTDFPSDEGDPRKWAKWFAKLSPEAAGGILSYFVAARERKQPLREWHEKLRRAAIERVHKTPIVWPTGSPAEKVAKAKKGAA